MNYLITEGYQSAAEKFSEEAEITSTVPIDSIEDRKAIRDDIHAGEIQVAIERINDLNPELLDTNPDLHFALLRLQLIELIRKCEASASGDITPALKFATGHLAARAQRNPVFLADLERTMALLCFTPNNLVPQLTELLDPSLRRQVASRVNRAILEGQGVMEEAKIIQLVRTYCWAEDALRQKNHEAPPLDIRNLA
ncbi:CTLH/CRA C-terminal to lish motif domain-containing protein [Lipomyces oligophaga]|uniref:CTLH/CRA C-terminal to lish motif domain-containing protein n=1 Tax=Lipomyces oligophaga TaxID=45792 RepID=UPI0034CD065A